MSFFRKAFAAVLAACSLFFVHEARAEQWTRKSFLLPDGKFELTGDPARPAMAEIGISRDAFAEPFALAPHFYWGVTNDLTIGISHQRGLCLHGCDRAYDDVGFDLMYFLTGSDKFELDLHAGVPIGSFGGRRSEDGNDRSPLIMGLQAGVIGKVNFGITSFVFDPSLYIGVTARDRGNTQRFNLPFWFYFQATDVIVPFVGSGIGGPFDQFSDYVAIPLEGGMLFDVAQDVDVGFSARFHNLFGADGSADFRSLYFLGRFRF